MTNLNPGDSEGGLSSRHPMEGLGPTPQGPPCTWGQHAPRARVALLAQELGSSNVQSYGSILYAKL